MLPPRRAGEKLRSASITFRHLSLPSISLHLTLSHSISLHLNSRFAEQSEARAALEAAAAAKGGAAGKGGSGLHADGGSTRGSRDSKEGEAGSPKSGLGSPGSPEGGGRQRRSSIAKRISVEACRRSSSSGLRMHSLTEGA